MTGLLTGIYTKFTELIGGNHNSFYTGLSGRMYLGLAPQESTYPYCVYNLITDTHNFQFTEKFEDVIVQFDIVSNSSSATECNTLFGYLTTLYDNTPLTVSSYYHIKTDRLYSSLTFYTDEAVWVYTVQYRVLIQKT